MSDIERIGVIGDLLIAVGLIGLVLSLFFDSGTSSSDVPFVVEQGGSNVPDIQPPTAGQAKDSPDCQ